MAIGQETVSVEVNTRLVGKALAKFVVDFKAALKSGNAVTEAIAIAAAALSDIAPVLSLVPSLEGEAKENLGAEVTTIMLCGEDIVKAILS